MYKVNESYFDEINSEDKAYILGYLYHKLSIKKSSNKIAVNNIKDLINEKLFYGTKEIKNNTIWFSNEYLINKLKEIGLSKELKTYPHIEEKYHNHFIRGMFDAGGNVTIRRCINSNIPRYISLPSSQEMLDDLQFILNKNNIKCKQEIFSKGAGIKISSMDQCKLFLDYIYNDSIFYDKEKREKCTKDIRFNTINNILNISNKKQPIDLLGQKFNRLKVIKLDEENTKRRSWICECECGNIKSIDQQKIISGHTKSCGCISGRYEKRKDYSENVKTGNVYERLRVIEIKGINCKCICNCGNIKETTKRNLVLGKTRSCGCLALESSINNLKSVSKESDPLSAAKRIFENYKDNEEITFDQFYYLSQKRCVYCLREPFNEFRGFKYNGLDRVDNNIREHEINNIVTCCADCNQAKMDHSLEYFLRMVGMISGMDNIDEFVKEKVGFVYNEIKLNKKFLSNIIE